MSSKAPARPWKSTSGRRSAIVADKFDGKGHLLSTDIDTSTRSDEEKYAIVDLVVRAVNSHDALVETLEKVLELAKKGSLPPVDPLYEGKNPIWDSVFNVLAAAKKEATR